jgi:hypothetical protein
MEEQACKTCGQNTHQMSNMLWCPVCGTIMTTHGVTHVPRLIERCRTFEKTLVPVRELWDGLGIHEAIRKA